MPMWNEENSSGEHSPLATRTASEMVSQGLALRQTQTNYVTAIAVQQPRNLRECEKKFIEEASLLGEDAFYGWSIGKDRIEGPSVHLALAAVRCFKNAVVEALPVQETAAAYIFTSAFVDLENGVTVTRQFLQAKNWEVHGRMDEARKEDIRFQIGQSKSHRNVILHAVPSWFIERGFQAAKQGVRKKIEQYIEKNSIDAARKLMIEAFARVGVTEVMLLSKLERTSVKAMTVEDMVVLQGDLRAIETGAESVDSLFPLPTAPESPTPGSSADRVKDRLRSRQPGQAAPQSTQAPEDIPAGGDTTEVSSEGTPEGQPLATEDQRAELRTLADQIGNGAVRHVKDSEEHWRVKGMPMHVYEQMKQALEGQLARKQETRETV